MSHKNAGNSPFYKYLSTEAKEHVKLVEYLRWVKPGLWWHTVNEGKRTPYEQFLWRVMGGEKSVPDFLFLDPRKGFSGLAVELKATGTQIFKKNGEPLKSMVPQWEMLQKLKAVGWKAEFAAGFDEALKLIKDYYEL